MESVAKKTRGRPKLDLTPEEKAKQKVAERIYHRKYYLNNPDKFHKSRGLENGYIYKMVNPVNDKIYVGCTTLELKHREHKHNVAIAKGSDTTFKKMAEICDKWEILPLVKCEVSSRSELEDLETIFISALRERVINIRKVYNSEDITHLLDGRYKPEYLPKMFGGLVEI